MSNYASFSSAPTMWQEARRQERMLRGKIVDHKKRAERRREYYERIVSRQRNL